MSTRRPGPPAMNRAGNGRGGGGADTTEAFMEQENNSLHMQLLAQTKAMKEIAIDIGDEVKVHNSLLDGLQADMLSAEGLLGGTVNRLSKVTGLKSNSVLCYLVGFCVFVFILMWYMMK
eukprot:m.25521 g.25521  ORF g.25521 m.25521 type:complete len:119 (+) comp11520_c0_seq1:1466-1822(+)